MTSTHTDQDHTSINSSITDHLSRIQYLENKAIQLENDIELIETVDLSGHVTNSELLASAAALQTEIQGVRNDIPDLSTFETTADVNTKVNAVVAMFNGFATLDDIDDTENLIPDVSNFVTQSDIDTSITAITTAYVQQTGGTLDGALRLENRESDQPTLDFSGQAAYSKYALEFTSNGPGFPKASFGTNDEFWEYAWQFSDVEDFCWKHGSNKIMSIAGDGVVVSNLKIGQFQPNLSTGRVVVNTVDVGQEINNIKGDITSLGNQQTSITALEDRNQIYYADTAPTAATQNGDLWFDSLTLRLYVKHGGAWIYPDRVEDTTLKTSLLNAVNNSTDYASLKANLITVLS